MKALVLGGAECVWDDIRSASLLFTPDLTLAVNQIGTVYPGRIDCWVTFHVELMPRWRAERQRHGHPDACEYWTNTVARRPDPTFQRIVLPRERLGGSSGLLAVEVALHKGASHVVLAGVPMDERRHFHNDQRGKPWEQAASFQKHWLQRRDHLAGKVRSLAGWTQGLLGAPTADWLAC